jgi:ActR/RegA family two-component response regulator
MTSGFILAVEAPPGVAVAAVAVALAALGAIALLTESRARRRALVLTAFGVAAAVAAVYFGYFLLFPGD